MLYAAIVSSSAVHVLQVKLFEIGVADLFGGQRRDQAAFFHDADVSTGFLGAEQVVRRHQHGHAFGAQTLKELGKLIRRLGIQTGRWLVQKQRLGLFGDGDRNADLLYHALAVARDSSPDGFLGLPGLDRKIERV